MASREPLGTACLSEMSLRDLHVDRLCHWRTTLQTSFSLVRFDSLAKDACVRYLPLVDFFGSQGRKRGVRSLVIIDRYPVLKVFAQLRHVCDVMQIQLLYRPDFPGDQNLCKASRMMA